MNNLNITLIQTDLFWEDSRKNLENFRHLLDEIPDSRDLIVLPEMFNTGFSINPDRCAETMNGPAMLFLQENAHLKKALFMGSILIREGDAYFNRLICMFPDGHYEHYDKRHLFRLSEEYKVFTGGSGKKIITWKEWNILPLVCYDLRFPVWSKNTFSQGHYGYDLLVYVANWPQSRSHAWKSLLIARAVENQSYVAGVNRIGNDGHGTPHSGDSMIIDAQGTTIVFTEPDKPAIISATLSKPDLESFRENFPFGQDWDHFTLDI